MASHVDKVIKAWTLHTRLGVTDVIFPLGFAQLIIMVNLAAVRTNNLNHPTDPTNPIDST